VQTKAKNQTYVCRLFVEAEEKKQRNSGAGMLLHVPRRELERNFEIVLITAGVTYHKSMVAFKHAIIDLHIGTTGINSSALEVACFPRRELERKFEIVLFAEKDRMKPKRSANESSNPPRSVEPGFTKIKTILIAQWPFVK
jgi:hypothetical protein